MFEKLDIDGDGFLVIEELKQGLVALKCPLTDFEVKRLFSSSDLDNNGMLDVGEFRQFLDKAFPTKRTGRRRSQLYEIGKLSSSLPVLDKKHQVAAKKRTKTRAEMSDHEKRQLELKTRAEVPVVRVEGVTTGTGWLAQLTRRARGATTR